MRKQKNPVTKSKRTKSKSENVSVKEVSSTKKRIKQKSLKQIVAQKLQKSSTSGKSRSSTESNKLETRVNIKHKESQREVSKASTESNNSDREKANKAEETSNEPFVSFAKVTKENFGKTLLARKRNVTDTNSKKTLSSIFSKLPESETKEISLLDSLKSVKEEERVIPKKKIEKKSKGESKKVFDSSEKVNLKQKKKKKQAEKLKIENDSKVEDNKNTNVSHKSIGKISSLFGHNPEIPNIGQRLVKPINEPVFTGTTFTDLNIHPFTVSIIYL